MREKTNELRSILASCRYAFVTTGAFSFFINILLLVSPLFMMQVYNRVLPSRNESTLVVLAVLACGLLLVMAALEAIRSRILVRVSAHIDNRLSDRVLQAIFTSALANSKGTSAQGMRDLDTLRQFLGGAGPLAFFDIPFAPVLIGVVYLMHPILGAIATGGALVLLSLALINELATHKPLEQANRHSVGVIGFIGSSLRNAEVLHAMGMFDNLRSRWFTRRNLMLQLQSVASDRAGIIAAIGKLLRQLLQVVLLSAGAYLAIHNDITSGAIIASSIVVGRALAPFEMAINTWKQFVSARTAYARLHGLLSQVPEVPHRVSLPAPTGALSLENIFAVPPGGSVPTLRQLTLRVPAGQSIGIVGPSGAGKTTLARLVVGAWPPYSGKVRLDGADIHHWNRDELGPYIGYMPQDVELFDGTVAENICRFGDKKNSAALVDAAKRAGVHDMILHLPQGYETQIGPSGATLSGGQRQRIGLARAVYGKPVLVVLDEPASNLDDEGEAALMRAVAALKHSGATVLMISHRPEILTAVDQMLVLANGTIRMHGPREEVMARLAAPAPTGPRAVVPHPQQTVNAVVSVAGKPSGGSAPEAPTVLASIPVPASTAVTKGGTHLHSPLPTVTRPGAAPDPRASLRPASTTRGLNP